MSSESIISVENLGKRYRLGVGQSGERYTALRDVITNKAKSLFRRTPLTSDLRRRTADDFWALRNVSFEVKQGEVLGIVGRNGAGKSTLLKILSRITDPTEGKVRTKGRVASLLEVGTGFHPELTGRENVYLNGAILGMTRAEIKVKFDEIVAFAEVERFLDTPVKRYSSGMYVRLAFAVAAHLEPEILVVDEVLAVGDAEFQKKCLGKMERVATEGRTVLFVSHNMGAIKQLCGRALLLRSGAVAADGEPKTVIKLYTSEVSAATNETAFEHAFRGSLASRMRINSVRVTDSDSIDTSLLSPCSVVRVEVSANSTIDVPAFRSTLSIFSNGVRLFSVHDVPHAEDVIADKPFKSVFEIPAYFLRPGDYMIAVGGHSASTGDWLWALDIAQFTILEEWDQNCRPYDTGIINLTWRGHRTSLDVLR